MNNQKDDSLDELLGAMAVSNIPKSSPPTTVKSSDEYDEKQELINTLKGLDELIASNSDILEEAKRLVESTGDVSYFEVYSNLGKSQSEAFKNKVKILMDKDKNKVLKETKDREISVKEKLVDFQISQGVEQKALPTTLNQTNVIMTGSREEALQFINQMKEVEKEKLIADSDSY